MLAGRWKAAGEAVSRALDRQRSVQALLYSSAARKVNLQLCEAAYWY